MKMAFAFHKYKGKFQPVEMLVAFLKGAISMSCRKND